MNLPNGVAAILVTKRHHKTTETETWIRESFMENDPDMDRLFEMIEGWRPTVPEWDRVKAFLDELKTRNTPQTHTMNKPNTHTPGPWTIADDSDGCILVTSPWSDKTKPGEASGYGDFRGLHICSIEHQGTNPCVSKAQAEANAKLIAVAPDLLKLLKDCHNVLFQFVDYQEGDLCDNVKSTLEQAGAL